MVLPTAAIHWYLVGICSMLWYELILDMRCTFLQNTSVFWSWLYLCRSLFKFTFLCDAEYWVLDDILQNVDFHRLLGKEIYCHVTRGIVLHAVLLLTFNCVYCLTGEWMKICFGLDLGPLGLVPFYIPWGVGEGARGVACGEGSGSVHNYMGKYSSNIIQSLPKICSTMPL